MDLEGIKKREQEATPGPWEFENGSELFNRGKPYNLQRREFVYEVEVHPQVLMKALVLWEPSRANADFIAHARTDIPVLVAEVERLRAAIRGAIFDMATAITECNGAATPLDFLEHTITRLREAVPVEPDKVFSLDGNEINNSTGKGRE
jgi:hypothetical protein